ncbi:hypothetical protein C1H46_018640 [Malus baccata]|uniref:Uncharacterized protein n=1 Tax=Malus baccata TaxID=106549 RepID=A0A540MAD8_MALBA|nr:hypothetical protein C1H46_018640 [Malus baccata]
MEEGCWMRRLSGGNEGEFDEGGMLEEKVAMVSMKGFDFADLPWQGTLFSTT